MCALGVTEQKQSAAVRTLGTYDLISLYQLCCNAFYVITSRKLPILLFVIYILLKSLHVANISLMQQLYVENNSSPSFFNHVRVR